MMTTKTNFRKQLNRQQQNKRMDSIGLLLIPILTILLGWGLHVLIGQPFLLTFPFNGIFIASIILISSIAYFLMRKFSSTTWLDDSFSITTLGLTWILMLLLFTFFPEDISRHHVTNIENIHLSWTAILMAIISIVFFTFKIIHRITEKRLKTEKVVALENGEYISYDVYMHVLNEENKWNVPTEVLYGSMDDDVYIENIASFLETHNARLMIKQGADHSFSGKENIKYIKNWIKQLL